MTDIAKRLTVWSLPAGQGRWGCAVGGMPVVGPDRKMVIFPCEADALSFGGIAARLIQK